MNSIAISEIRAIFRHWLMWYFLGMQDIKLRYRRSTIGPFWITISMAVTVYTMGFLYGHLFKIQLEHYFPYLASGIITWSLISMILTESSLGFIEAENYIRNQETFPSVFIARIIFRNLVVFLHNIIVFIPIIFVFHLTFSADLLWLIPGFILIVLNGIFWGTLLGLFGTRYRDFPPILASIIQVAFFLTPIMWMPTALPTRYHWVTLYNPFNSILDFIRNPLINAPIAPATLIIAAIITLVGFLLYVMAINKSKHRLVFWL